MEIEFNGKDGRPLCFTHAVKAIIEKNESIKVDVPDCVQDENDYTGYLGQICGECYPAEED